MEEGTAHNNRQAGSSERYLDQRVKDLILALTEPQSGEKVLVAGCGRGEHLSLFQQKGCDVTGIDPSSEMIDSARLRLAHRVDLRRGRLEDLPFSDNEFDIVALIASLEFTEDPARAFDEAIRVCRGRIFIGVTNRFSLPGARERLLQLFDAPGRPPGRFFHLPGLAGMIRQRFPEARPRWGSVIFLPWFCYDFAAGLEERIPVMKNPFGAFLGLSFPASASLQTIQEVIHERLAMEPEGSRPIAGIIRELKHAP